MKKCPTCEKTFEDSMRFCQVDGTPLVDDAPAFDPYATIVARPFPTEQPVEIPAEPEPVAETPAEPEIHQTVGSIPIAEPDDVLDLPTTDPLKTMYVSEAEMQSALANADIMEIPPIEEAAQPAPPSFIAPEAPPAFEPPAPAYEPEPPASPFAAEEPAPPAFIEPDPVPAPVFEEPVAAPITFEEAKNDFDEAATVIQPAFQPSFEQPQASSSPFDAPPPTPSPFDEPSAPAPSPFDQASTPSPFEPVASAPMEQWTPPPAPEPSWQNQEIGSNTPFQPPPTGATGENKTLAIVSLVLAILSFVCLGFLGSIPAIILGFMQRSKVKNNPAEFGGAGMAMAGIIIGALNVVFSIVVLILYAGLILANIR
ncbi:MAG: DUF4190 domain-containing protein [Pyrinomonadaceae bacterium]